MSFPTGCGLAHKENNLGHDLTITQGFLRFRTITSCWRRLLHIILTPDSLVGMPFFETSRHVLIPMAIENAAE